jgi:hypothetical protein
MTGLNEHWFLRCLCVLVARSFLLGEEKLIIMALSSSSFLDDVAALVEQAENLRQKEGALIELETRLGKITSSGFDPGVRKPVYERILMLMQSTRGWARVTPWKEMVDYYYDDMNDEPVRTTVMFDEMQRKICQRHIRKTKIASIDLQEKSTQIDVRVALAIEQEIDASLIPEIVNPYLVRIKQRRSIYYTPNGMTDPVWVYDLTLTWQGETKEEAEYNQKECEPICEVEVECLSPGAYRQHNQEDYKFVAKSLLLKILDFFPPSNPELKCADAARLLQNLELVRIK